jgi:hypothetical protein
MGTPFKTGGPDKFDRLERLGPADPLFGIPAIPQTQGQVLVETSMSALSLGKQSGHPS